MNGWKNTSKTNNLNKQQTKGEHPTCSPLGASGFNQNLCIKSDHFFVELVNSYKTTG